MTETKLEKFLEIFVNGIRRSLNVFMLYSSYENLYELNHIILFSTVYNCLQFDYYLSNITFIIP